MHSESLHTAKMRLWLERFRGGDLAARDELLKAVLGRLEHLARKMLKRYPSVQRWAQTDDVLQNGAMRLLRSLEHVKPESLRQFFGLAATQMRRELLDMARHFTSALGDHASHPAQGLDALAPDTNADDIDKWQAFHQEIDKLPVEEREVVSLIFYHGWTRPQVAELFEVHERTVRRWWKLALLKVQPLMKQALDED